MTSQNGGLRIKTVIIASQCNQYFRPSPQIKVDSLHSMPVWTALAQTHCTEYDVDQSLQSQNEENCASVQILLTE